MSTESNTARLSAVLFVNEPKDIFLLRNSAPRDSPRRKTLSPLTGAEKEENRVISSFRVIVENTIAGIKRFKAYADIWRNRITHLDDRVMRIVCGLWNLHIEMGV
ncbi:MAG: hypothetical protein HZB12_03235 [Candidatus Yonathbacteria bacterium]|nr:hypothetical protein [Candidatus Yonathbacteria bacterium]